MKIVERINGIAVAVSHVTDDSTIPPEAYCSHCGELHTFNFIHRAESGHLVFWCARCRVANTIEPWLGNHADPKDQERLTAWAGQFA